MEKFCTRLCYIIFIILCDCSGYIQTKENINPLFVFGDSIFDAGNNNYINTSNGLRANFSPYGETFFNHATGRFSDGRLIPDFIAEFANLPLIPPFLEDGQRKNWAYGVNFASGGSGALVETNAGQVIDLNAQLGYFKNVEKELRSQVGNRDAKHLLSISVYLFSVGGNDLMVHSSSAVFSLYSLEDYVTVIIDNVTGVIMELHKKGARKFGFFSIFPIGCIPYFRALKKVEDLQCEEKLTYFTKFYNEAFSQRLQDLEKQLKGFHYSYFDSVTVGMDMIDNPSKYGFEEVRSACCGSGAFGGIYSCGGMRGIKEYELCKNPMDFLFFDSFHPTEKAHRLLAELMWHGGADVAWPLNLKSLFEVNSYLDDVI